jgi:hypothetical protein
MDPRLRGDDGFVSGEAANSNPSIVIKLSSNFSVNNAKVALCIHKNNKDDV